MTDSPSSPFPKKVITTSARIEVDSERNMVIEASDVGSGIMFEATLGYQRVRMVASVEVAHFFGELLIKLAKRSLERENPEIAATGQSETNPIYGHKDEGAVK
jgi:hypothetical protein